MPATSKLLDDLTFIRAKEGLKQIGKSAVISKKLQAIVSAKTHGISKVAAIYNVTNKSLTFWIKSLRNGSLYDLTPKNKATQTPLLGKSEGEIILKWIEQDSNLTIKKIRLKIKKEIQITVSKLTVHRLIKNLGFSYVNARPNTTNKKKFN